MRRLKRWLGRRRSSVEVSESRGVRTLHLGGDAIQSAIRLASPDRLELAYTRAMMAFLLFRPAPRDVLMIGLGGGSIARFVHERLPGTRITVVEINPKVVAAARSYFGLPDDRRVQVLVEDAAALVPTLDAACDVLLLDAFEDGRSVPALATRAFYDGCREALRPGGMLVVNFIADEPKFGLYLARLEQAFGGRVLCLPAEDRVNIILLAFRDCPAQLPIEPLERSARSLKRRFDLPFDRFVHDLVGHNPGTSDELVLGRGAPVGATPNRRRA
jgi:spermidine synthase